MQFVPVRFVRASSTEARELEGATAHQRGKIAMKRMSDQSGRAAELGVTDKPAISEASHN